MNCLHNAVTVIRRTRVHRTRWLCLWPSESATGVSCTSANALACCYVTRRGTLLCFHNFLKVFSILHIQVSSMHIVMAYTNVPTSMQSYIQEEHQMFPVFRYFVLVRRKVHTSLSLYEHINTSGRMCVTGHEKLAVKPRIFAHDHLYSV